MRVENGACVGCACRLRVPTGEVSLGCRRAPTLNQVNAVTFLRARASLHPARSRREASKSRRSLPSPCPPPPSSSILPYSAMLILSPLSNGTSNGGNNGYEIPSLPHISRATFAGIVVAISGNVVISFALNCQKLAHKRLELQRAAEGDELQSQSTSGETGGPLFLRVNVHTRVHRGLEQHSYLRRSWIAHSRVASVPNLRAFCSGQTAIVHYCSGQC